LVIPPVYELPSAVIVRSGATWRSRPQPTDRRTGLLRRPRPPRNDERGSSTRAPLHSRAGVGSANLPQKHRQI